MALSRSVKSYYVIVLEFLCVAIPIAFFALMTAYVRACARLLSTGEEERGR